MIITASSAKDIIVENIKDISPNAVYDYNQEFYLVVAPNTNGVSNDPFYLVRKTNGDYRVLNPLENIKIFSECMEHGPILTFNK